MQTAYLAAPGFEKELEIEIHFHSRLKLLHKWQRLYLVDGPLLPLAWAQQVWLNPELVPLASIKQAADHLKSSGRNWFHYAFHLHRRSALIQEKLPKFKPHPLRFGEPMSSRAVGGWCLLDENKALVAPVTWPPWPQGELRFHEDKAAPSRAYLKLWEFFCLEGIAPQTGDICIDLGSSPGGWTWVLAQLGCEVYSLDKAPLDARLIKKPNVHYQKKDAFKASPQDFPPIDWLFSDIICTPQRLLELVKRWSETKRVKNFVCTVKFKGNTDLKILAEFQRFPNSKLRHLSCNKHELTWCWGEAFKPLILA